MSAIQCLKVQLKNTKSKKKMRKKPNGTMSQIIGSPVNTTKGISLAKIRKSTVAA